MMVVLVSCVARRPSSGAEPLGLRLPPSSLGRPLSLVQRITLFHRGERRSFEALLEVDAERLQVALLAPGQTLARLVWDGAALDVRTSAYAPAGVTPERVLEDIQLVWWPLEAVQAALGRDVSVLDTGNSRQVLRGGVPLARVTYEGEGPVWSRVVVDRGLYRLEIESREELQ